MRFVIGLLAIIGTSCVSAATESARSTARLDMERGPEVASAAVPAGSTGCEELAARIARAHPAPLAAIARARASLHRSHAAASAPGPAVSLEVWDFPIGDPARADREGMYMVGIRQEIPVLAALDAEGRAEAELSHAESADGRDAMRMLFLEAGRGCVDWIVSSAIAGRSRDYANHLAEVRDAAIAAYGAGSGGTSLGSIARAEADIARVKRRTIELEEQARSARDGLAALAGGSVALPDEVPVLSEPPAELDLEAATAAALAARGDVAAARFRSAAASARAEGAKEVAETPRFEVGATYMQMPDARPGLGAMVSMTMPWIGGGLLDESDAAEEESAATRHQASAVERAARVEIQAQLSKLRAAKRTLAAIEESELPAAERAARAERAGLGAANFDLTAWLLASHGVLEARIEREVARGSVARAWLELQGSLGVLGTEKKR